MAVKYDVWKVTPDGWTQMFRNRGPFFVLKMLAVYRWAILARTTTIIVDPV